MAAAAASPAASSSATAAAAPSDGVARVANVLHAVDNAHPAAKLPEIQRFREFLRIPSVTLLGPRGPYQRAVEFLQATIRALPGLRERMTTRVVECVKDKPILVATLPGAEPELPSLLLNGHYDVVPAVREMWASDPFAADMLANGDILARGAQDMKPVCMQYLEALSRLAARGERLRRTVHLTFVPDEEIGGSDGMELFVETPEFREMRVGAGLDEGLANDKEDATYTVFYGERAVWWLLVRAKGPAGHGSRFVERTAMEKLVRCVNRFLAFREEQRQKLHAGCRHAVALKLGDVATVNLTALQGGVSPDGGKTFNLNVIPTEALAGFDVRIPPSMPLSEMDALLREWTSEEGVSFEFTYRTREHAVTSTDRRANPFWAAFEDCMAAQQLRVEAEVFPAGTDSRYLRRKGIPVFGFSPLARTPVLLHDHNERVNADTYMRGIAIYERVIPALANV